MSRKKPFSEIPVIKTGRLTLRGLAEGDAKSLRELTEDAEVYRFLPTFLFEKKYADADEVIKKLYTECIGESLILGVFDKDGFCGLAELYGFRDAIHKISVGYRFVKRCWGRGYASEALGGLLEYLYGETDAEIITASTMTENAASARVLAKNGFTAVARADEDWGYPEPTLTDKWIN
ncbi:MAG: GNAT family N-acetyltransferase [Clostridia bacterium]|nr:GNAT family N-acetyltransferase [Clostridia bacterium]